MYVLYSLLLFLSLFIFIPVYFVRLTLLKKEKLNLKQRLGFSIPDCRGKSQILWIHAVSVGEVLSLQNLIRRIKEKHPDWGLCFSSLTQSGINMAKEKLVGIDTLFFIPLDFKCIVKKYFKIIKPKVFVLAESEFWPNLLKEAHNSAQGVLLVNGRISTSSFKRYFNFRLWTRRVLKNIDRFLVQTGRDKESLEKIGVESDLIEIAGNLKSEVDLPDLTDADLSALKDSLNIPLGKRIVLAGSTRKGEEIALLNAYKEARLKDDKLLFILAPRHIKRARDIERLCEQLGIRFALRTSLKQGQDWNVLILDTLGELARFYALSDIAFVGGSLVPWGGQNFLEPAFYGKPIFFGQHMDNFSFFADRFLEKDAAQVVSTQDDLINMFLMKDSNVLKEMGARAKKALGSLQGATEKTLQAVEKYMEMQDPHV
jgi:3-deoxy-D-manno-octulosonic-acid transferase